MVMRGFVGILFRVGGLARGVSLWVVVVVVGAVTLGRLVVVAPITLHPNLVAITFHSKGVVIFTSQTNPAEIPPSKGMIIFTSHISPAETTPSMARAKVKAVDKEEEEEGEEGEEGVEEEA